MPGVDEDQVIFLNLPIGGFLRIQDEIALVGNMQKGEGLTAKEYEIKNRKTILAHTSDFGETLPIIWLIYTLENADGEILLFYVRQVTTDDEVIIDKAIFYYPMGEGESMSREDLFNADILWMFDEPKGHNWEACDLELSKNPSVPPIDEDGEEIDVNFKMKNSGVMFGRYHSQTLNAWVPVMITEYVQDPVTTKNPRMLIIEDAYLDENGEPIPEGGIVDILLGCSVNDNCLEVI